MQLGSMVANAATESEYVVKGVDRDQMNMPTPCTEWDVHVLGNHLLQVISALKLAGAGQAVPDEHWASDQMSDDWATHFGEHARQAVEAWSRPNAWDGMVTMGSAQMPAGFVATMLVSDLVIHGWDLAQATGQAFRCDDDTANMALQFVAETGAQGRKMGIYAEPVSLSEDASPLQRAIALSGRDPNWHPAV